jgi:hypothetical protein
MAEALKERRTAVLKCPKCFKELGSIREPRAKKTFSCPKHGRFVSKADWHPFGWDGTNQHFITTQKKGK